jgi:3-methyladenine DNA glycosylase AlkD
MASVDGILKRLKAAGAAENIVGMARYGITVKDAYGVPMAEVKALAKELGRDHARAQQLWATGIREAQLLAAFTADPLALTRGEMTRWAGDFNSWDVCDGVAIHLFRKSPLAWEMARKWAGDKREFVRRAGFAMFATLAVHDRQAADKLFLEVLPLIETAAGDKRNFVKKAVNWALRQIGKRNAALRRAAVVLANSLAERDEAEARWIGKDALRELSASARTRHS